MVFSRAVFPWPIFPTMKLRDPCLIFKSSILKVNVFAFKLELELEEEWELGGGSKFESELLFVFTLVPFKSSEKLLPMPNNGSD